MLHGRDVHMLAYFFDPALPALVAFLAAQREARIARVEAIVARLAELGMPVNFAAQIAGGAAADGHVVGAPARGARDGGRRLREDVQDAFDAWLGEGRPAFIERVGPSPETVIAIVHAAGGLVSLAHPGRTRIDEEIPGWWTPAWTRSRCFIRTTTRRRCRATGRWPPSSACW